MSPHQRHTDSQVKSMVVPVLFLVAGVACWWVLARRNANLSRGLAAAEIQAQLAQNVRVMRGQVAAAEATVQTPGAGHSQWWKDYLYKEATRHQLAPLGFEPSAPDVKLGRFFLLTRELVVRGNYEAVLKFLSWQESASPRTRLERFKIEPVGPGLVRANLVVLLPSPGGK
jgi:hypothetical protein